MHQQAALAKYRLTQLQEDLAQFRIRRAQARILIRSSKKNSWHKFIDSIEEDTHPTSMWRKIQILNNCKPPPPTITLPQNDGVLTQDSQVISELLAKAFSSVSSDSSYNPGFLAYKTQEELSPLIISNDKQEDYNSPITMEELRQSLSKLTKNTAPGPDNIFIKQLPENMLNVLLKILYITRYGRSTLFLPSGLPP